MYSSAQGLLFGVWWSDLLVNQGYDFKLIFKRIMPKIVNKYQKIAVNS